MPTCRLRGEEHEESGGVPKEGVPLCERWRNPMEIDWRVAVTDVTETLIFEALEDAAGEWRTAGALSEVSGLSVAKVSSILRRYPGLVRTGFGQAGEELYRLQQRYSARRSLWRKVWDFLSGASSSSSSTK